jgi:hypothetical protein
MVSHVTRREVLQSGGLVAFVGSAGCSTLQADDDTMVGQRLGAVSVHNDTPTDATVAVVIVRDGERVYWREHEIGGTTTAGNTTVNRSTAITPPDFDPGFGRYLVGVRVRETSENGVFDLTDVDREDDCYHVIMSLTGAGPAFGFGSSDEYTNCEDGDSARIASATNYGLASW